MLSDVNGSLSPITSLFSLVEPAAGCSKLFLQIPFTANEYYY